MDEKQKKLETIKCGIIMPISPIDGCSAEHWAEVKSIFCEATMGISTYNINTIIVSEAEDIGIIQKRIVQNIYNSDIIICDVSGKNPNVMFELGMRLAFDKPTIIVKDDQTNYSFDTGIIEHLEYPRDLRFSKIVEFKKKLSSKLVATLEESRKNPEHSTFLKSFGQFKVSTLSEHEVTSDKAIWQSIEDLRHEMYLFRKDSRRKMPTLTGYPREAILRGRRIIDEAIEEIGATSIEDVFKSTDLYSRMVERLNPQRYFPDEDDFKKFYDYLIGIYEVYP